MQALSTKVPMAWFYVTLPSNSVLMSQVTGEPTHSLGLGCGVCVCVCVCVLQVKADTEKESRGGILKLSAVKAHDAIFDKNVKVGIAEKMTFQANLKGSQEAGYKC